MPKLSEIAAAGLSATPRRGVGESILAALSGGVQNAIKQTDEKPTKDMQMLDEQVKLYNNLREAGYSPEDAHTKVKGLAGGTGFINKILTGGQKDALGTPTEEDQTALNTRKANAAIYESEGKGSYYANGGKSTSVSGKTLETLQKYRADLLDFMKNPGGFEPGSRGDKMTPENSRKIADIDARIGQLAGLPQNQGAGNVGGNTGKYPVGSRVRIKGGGTGIVRGYRNGNAVVVPADDQNA